MSDKTLPALLGGDKTNQLPVPAWPVIDELDLKRMQETVKSGKWSWVGENEQAFCREYAAFIGTEYCMCMANGTVTLQCALQAAGVVPGDEVIVPALTWVATAQAALDIGANVVLVDIDPETYCIDPKALEAAVNEKTKAVIPVHLYGSMCDMDAVMELAKKYSLKVIEDVAHQQGSQWRDKKAGAIGDAGSYSFQQSKILTSGEGGAVTCRDEDLYKTAFALKQVGWTPEKPSENPFGGLVPGNHYGHNYRITEMQAVLLRGGLSRLPAQNQRREANAAKIAAGLARINGPLRTAKRDPRVTIQAYYGMTLHFDTAKADGLTRDQFLKAVQAEGVSCGGTYPPVYRSMLLNLYDRTSPIPFRDPAVTQDYANLKLPVTEKVVSEEGVIMSHQHLLGSDEYIETLLAGVEKVCGSLDIIRDHFEKSEN